MNVESYLTYHIKHCTNCNNNCTVLSNVVQCSVCHKEALTFTHQVINVIKVKEKETIDFNSFKQHYLNNEGLQILKQINLGITVPKEDVLILKELYNPDELIPDWNDKENCWGNPIKQENKFVKLLKQLV